MKNIKHIFVFICILMLWNTDQIQAQIGTFFAVGDFSLASTASYEAELKDLNGAGIGHDQVAISGNLNLDGSLDILLSGYSPIINDNFEIMSYGGTLSGTFSTINWPADMVSQGWQIDYGILNPGFVTIYGSFSPLPIELLSFEVYQKNESHLLTWQTATEINNDFFSVEHSLDGREFSALGQIESKGNQAGIQAYNYTNKENRSGLHYYRLQQIDFNGESSYSNIVSISNKVEEVISFFPNPSSGSITFNKAVSDLVIYDLRGSVVLELKNSGTTFDLSKLPTGTYLVRANEASSVIEKLIINR